jgi:endogenous inhibitor of DNA gyrase (YacG/DUF329 family)
VPSLCVWFVVYVCFLGTYNLELNFFALKLQACDHSNLDMQHMPIGIGLGRHRGLMRNTGLLCSGTCANYVVFTRSPKLSLFCSKGCKLIGDWWEAEWGGEHVTQNIDWSESWTIGAARWPSVEEWRSNAGWRPKWADRSKKLSYQCLHVRWDYHVYLQMHMNII